jgi:hypothetical protein
MVDRKIPVTPVVFLRGNPGRRGAEVPRQFLKVLSGPDRQPFQIGSGRLELARAITSRENPLTARVFVNRVWGHLFGGFLVDTPSDFGRRSEQPILKEVLDQLALDFMDHNWSPKWLIRELVMSTTYQQSSHGDAAALERDPENRMFSRSKLRRLDFEALRDSMLIVSGQLRDEQIGGPSTPVEGEKAVLRRSLYAFIDRQNLPGLFRVFDLALPDTHAPKRYETTVPQQALYLLNSEFAWQVAEKTAERQDATYSPSTVTSPLEERIRAIYRTVLARDPSDDESQQAADFIIDPASGQPRARAWVGLAHVLIMSNEFSYLQ